MIRNSVWAHVGLQPTLISFKCMEWAPSTRTTMDRWLCGAAFAVDSRPGTQQRTGSEDKASIRSESGLLLVLGTQYSVLGTQ